MMATVNKHGSPPSHSRLGTALEMRCGSILIQQRGERGVCVCVCVGEGVCWGSGQKWETGIQDGGPTVVEQELG